MPKQYLDDNGNPISAPKKQYLDDNGNPVKNQTETPSIDISNKSGEGTYPMWNDRGEVKPVPYSKVSQAQGLGWKFDENPMPLRNGLMPYQAYSRDQYADPKRKGGTTLRMSSGLSPEEDRARAVNIEKNAPAPIRAMGGIAKGAGEIARPVLDVVALGTGQTPEDINEMLETRTPLEKGFKYGTVASSLAVSAPAALAAPLATAGGLAAGAAGMIGGKKLAETMGATPQQTAVAGDITGLAGGLLGSELGSLAQPLIRNAAIGDLDVAALRASGVPQNKALKFREDVQGARPYLSGVKNVEELQGRAGLGGTARKEIYKPIDDVLQAHGYDPMIGPDGRSTTLNDLENRRSEISGQLRKLREGGPEATALAIQKGLKESDLMAEQAYIESAMDPVFAKYGVDAPLVRKTYGQVSRVGDEFAGRWTASEPKTNYGVGNMLNMKIQNPKTWVGAPAQGARDILAGRPLWRGNSGDVGVREAFGGAEVPKPDFRSTAPPLSTKPLQLPSKVDEYGEYVGPMYDLPKVGEGIPARPGPVVTPYKSLAGLLTESTQGPNVESVGTGYRKPIPQTNVQGTRGGFEEIQGVVRNVNPLPKEGKTVTSSLGGQHYRVVKTDPRTGHPSEVMIDGVRRRVTSYNPETNAISTDAPRKPMSGIVPYSHGGYLETIPQEYTPRSGSVEIPQERLIGSGEQPPKQFQLSGKSPFALQPPKAKGTPPPSFNTSEARHVVNLPVKPITGKGFIVDKNGEVRPIPAGELPGRVMKNHSVGDAVMVRGQRMKITSINQKTGEFTLEPYPKTLAESLKRTKK